MVQALGKLKLFSSVQPLQPLLVHRRHVGLGSIFADIPKARLSAAQFPHRRAAATHTNARVRAQLKRPSRSLCTEPAVHGMCSLSVGRLGANRKVTVERRL